MLAPRGGALAIPLPATDTTQTPDVRWSNTRTKSEVQLSTLSEVPRLTRAWSLPPTRITLGRDQPGQRLLLIRLPNDDAGSLILDGQNIALQWEPLPDQMPRLGEGMEGVFTPTLAWPPLDDPLSQWRCELFASLAHLPAPDIARFDRRDEQLLALAVSGPWRIAMHRLAAMDTPLARRVANSLAGVVKTPIGFAACQVRRAAASDQLLAILLDLDAEDHTLTQRVAHWCDRNPPQCVWIESDQGASVEIAMANPLETQVITEVAWGTPGEVPLGIALPAGHIALEPMDPLPPPQNDVPLVFELGTQHLILPINREPLVIEPPGLMIGPLLPMRTLTDVRAAVMPPPPPMEMQTLAQVRRLMGKWEIMLECRWPQPPPPGTIDWVDITIVNQGVRHVARVAPEGLRSFDSPTTETPTAHNSRQDHAWLCRVVLPESWVSGDTFKLALRRKNGVEETSWPTPDLPWKQVTDPATLDMRHWDAPQLQLEVAS